MKKYILLLLLPLQLLAKDLVVGTTTGYAPFVNLDARGNYEGFDIDFSRLLAQKLGRKWVLRDCGSMPGLLMALQQKKIDVIIWGMSMTPQRMEKLEMIYYQGEKTTKMPFLFWGEPPENLNAIEAIDPSWMVSVEGGSYQEDVLKCYPRLRVKQVEKITDAILEIRFGKSKMAVTDPALVSELTTQYPELKVLYLDLRPEEIALGNGVCVRKDQRELIAQIQKAIEELTQENQIAALEEKWRMRG